LPPTDGKGFGYISNGRAILNIGQQCFEKCFDAGQQLFCQELGDMDSARPSSEGVQIKVYLKKQA
jgi:hypothetical protein